MQPSTDPRAWLRPLLSLCGAALLGAATLVAAATREPVYSPDRGSAQAESAAEADWPARVGRISEVQGTVRLYDHDDAEWVDAQPNRPLTSGDQLVTEPGARLEIGVGSTTLRLDGGSELVLARIDDQSVVLQLRRGSLAVRVASAETARETEVQTAEGRFQPREPGHYRIDRRDDATTAGAWRGTLRFEGRDSTLVIGGGQHAEIWLQGAERTTHYRWTDDPRDDFARWVAADDAAAERSESARYVSTEMTGWQDLDQHGRWHTHPEYGAVWAPLVVAADWAPYRSGHWRWIAPWGWTWVDSARWGFAPFHYGRWVHWNRRWCWVPGPRVARPVFSPALVAWVGGPHVSVGISIGAPIGWVPLGPRDVYRRHDRHDRNDRNRDRRNDDRRGPGTVPTGPIMYTNQGVPGAVTIVPRDAFAQERRVVHVNGTPSTPVRVTPGATPAFTAIAPPPAPPSSRGRDVPRGERREPRVQEPAERRRSGLDEGDATPGTVGVRPGGTRPPVTAEPAQREPGVVPLTRQPGAVPTARPPEPLPSSRQREAAPTTRIPGPVPAARPPETVHTPRPPVTAPTPRQPDAVPTRPAPATVPAPAPAPAPAVVAPPATRPAPEGPRRAAPETPRAAPAQPAERADRSDRNEGRQRAPEQRGNPRDREQAR